MKNLVFILAAAAGILVSCTKNEVAPAEPQEITYMTAPLVKANVEFDADKVFWSWAYHTGEYDWTYGSHPIWIDGEKISYKPANDVWKGTNSYYWPKNGDKLTFFAYSINDVDGKTLTNATVSCPPANGIKVTGFTTADNLNVDFMVADIAANKTANENVYDFEPETDVNPSGVPTLFKHKLSQVVFTVKTTSAYAGKTFNLKSITFNKISGGADYYQYNAGVEGWSNYGADVATTSYYSGSDVPFADTKVTPLAIQSLYIPQNFTDETVTIVYTITTGSVTETLTMPKKLSEIFTANWEMGKKYTCDITIGLNEISWDPAVVDWTDGVAVGWGIN